jgi:hypothetical protein
MISPGTPNRPRHGRDYFLFVDLPSSEEAAAAMKAVNGITSPWGGTLRVEKSTNFPGRWRKGNFGLGKQEPRNQTRI